VTDLLFVYGTLLSSVDHPMGARLRREADRVGEATVPGRLYRVSWYPGVVATADGSTVHGELYRLHDPNATWPWLDDFEGVTRGDTSVTSPDAYVRTTVTATTPTGPEVAWVYLYQGPIAHLTPIPSGFWQP
jgi:gamma-glutamylcyclotransferase (GGCT)/AIG2-like uncharacterized protein YtfP